LEEEILKRIESGDSSAQKQLDELRAIKPTGWILVDFPSSLAQAKLLEEALGGFEPEVDRNESELSKYLKDACFLCQPNPKAEALEKLTQSGLDGVFWINTTPEECIRRAIGRRYDSHHENMYHIDDNPPASTSAPLCERLTPIEDPVRPNSTLIDRHLAFDKCASGLKKWLSKFGENDENWDLLQNIEGNNKEEEIFTECKDKSQMVLKFKEKLQDFLMEKIRVKRREAEARRKKEEEEEAIRVAAEAAKAAKEGAEGEDGEGEAPEEEKKEDSPAEEEEELEELQSRDNIDNDFKPVLFKLWTQVQDRYIADMKKIFRATR
jgi:hypothetical protein